MNKKEIKETNFNFIDFFSFFRDKPNQFTCFSFIKSVQFYFITAIRRLFLFSERK